MLRAPARDDEMARERRERCSLPCGVGTLDFDQSYPDHDAFRFGECLSERARNVSGSLLRENVRRYDSSLTFMQAASRRRRQRSTDRRYARGLRAAQLGRFRTQG